MKTLLQMLAENPKGWGNAPPGQQEAAWVDDAGNVYGFDNQIIASGPGPAPGQSWAELAKGVATAPARIATSLVSGMSPYGQDGWQVPPLAQEAMEAISAPGRAYYEGMSPEEMQRTATSAAGFAMGGGGLAAGRGPMVAANASKEGALPALANALDMSPEARLARAKELGFDTSRTLYHGTKADFDTFDPTQGSTPGAWFTTNQAAASQFGDAKPYFVRTSNAASLKDFAAARRAASGEPGAQEFNADVIRILQESGFDSVADSSFRGAGGSGSEVISILDPRNIRSVNAAFDPAKSDSADLLAANASKGAGAASVASQPNNQTDIIGLLSSLFAKGRK